MALSAVVVRAGGVGRALLWSCVLALTGTCLNAQAARVALAWDPSADPTVAGYRLYYGGASANYTNVVDVNNNTSATVSNLVASGTYYFAATSYNLAGLESAYSTEVAYVVPPTVPANVPPTLDPIADVMLPENTAPVVVNLTGITSGSSNEVQTLSVSAFSSNPALVPNPTVNYTSPGTAGTLTVAPLANSFGLAVVTVMVDDGGATSNTLIRTFGVTVNQAPPPPDTITNLAIAPNFYLRLPLNPPFTNRDKVTWTLAAGAPAGAGIVTSKKTGTAFVWVPTFSQASSTNLITLVLTDQTNPALSTNQNILVIVQDYLGAGPGYTSLQAGQRGTVPLVLNCSDGVTNLSFTISWPGSTFPNPALSNVLSSIASSSIQNQGTNLVLNFQLAAGQVLQGSNLLAQLNFQTVSNQPSAFVSLPVTTVSGLKPNGVSYQNSYPQAGQVVVVNNNPLLLLGSASGNTATLTMFGSVGSRYQVQTATNLVPPVTWSALTTYRQATVMQTMSLNLSNYPVAYRLLQQ